MTLRIEAKPRCGGDDMACALRIHANDDLGGKDALRVVDGERDNSDVLAQKPIVVQ